MEVKIVFGLWFFLSIIIGSAVGLSPLRERARSWGDEWLVVRKDENELGPFNAWNISGTYRGSWRFLDSTNSSSRFPDFRKSNGNSVLELITTPTKIHGVHYVQFHYKTIVCTLSYPLKYVSKNNSSIEMDSKSLFNAFATAAFFKFVVFSIFEMRYLPAIWKAGKPLNNGEGWEAMRRELSVLYSRFYGILLGGILVMYEFHKYLWPILLLLHSFWVPQIITNVVRDSRKPLHPHYILGITVTRLAIPFYVFGCPHNFMRIEPDRNWCICLGVFMSLQAAILLLQHYLGSRWFIPRQILPEKYCYYRRLEQDANHTTDCVICMTAVDLTQRSNDRMVTPYDHFFHSGCLQRWMDIKMECPTCRRSLPPA